jgi:hypothetical protein
MALKNPSSCALFDRLCDFQSHVLIFDFRVLFAFMEEVYPVPDGSDRDVTGEDRDTY